MSIKRLTDLTPLTARDGSLLREFLHPDTQDLALRYSLAHALVRPGAATIPHRLTSSEVYYILSGQGRMHIDEAVHDVGPDCTVYIPPRAVQSIENTGDRDLVFLCIVDPAWRAADEEVLGGRRTNDEGEKGM